MLSQDTLAIRGFVDIELQDAAGRVKETRHVPNLVVTAGKVVIAERLGTASPTKAVMSHMAVGTNNTAANASDTTLNTELARVALTSGTPSTNTVVYIATFGAGTGTGTLVEAGLFNHASTGDMLCRTVFSSIAKAAGDSLTITWTLTVS